MKLSRQAFRFNHRQARLGNLGLLAVSLTPKSYQWFLTQVYDLRYPHIGDERHLFRQLGRRTFCDTLSRADLRALRQRLWYARYYKRMGIKPTPSHRFYENAA
ncbi:MAG: hypothetical protein C5B50_01015 [Verrucomicrobia bacterium]|nr:MAG: hypothetical protein C5B50_01015 [Verrucomicrobiota bacterium]